MLGKIVRGIFLFVIAFVGIGFLLPGAVHLERSVDIAAPASVVYEQINELKNWENWSPWAKIDPNVKWVYSPQTSGVGAYYTWAGNKQVGEGKLTILDTKPNESSHCKMEFSGQGDSFADFKLTPKDNNSTNIVWVFDTDLGINPIARWIGLGMNGFIGSDYEKGLTNLKMICETKK